MAKERACLGRGVGRGSVFGLALGIAWLPNTAAHAGDWDIVPSVNAETTFTDNAFGEAASNEADLFNTMQGTIGVRGTGARVNLNFDASVARDFYVDHTELNAQRESFTGFGNIELWKNYLVWDLRGSLSQQAQNRTGVNAAGQRVLSENQTQVLSFSTGPTLRHRYGSWADTEASYKLSGTRSLETDLDETGGAGSPGGTTTHRLATSVTSGNNFNQLSWDINTSTSITERGADGDREDRIIDANVEYKLTRAISLRAGLGYEDRTEPDLTDDTSGETWSVGTRLTPGPRTDVVIDYESRFNEEAFNIDGSYILGPAATLSFSYGQDIRTSQSQIGQSLDGLTVNADGDFVGPDGTPIDPNNTGTDLIDQTSLTQTFNASLVGAYLRNTYSASLTYRIDEFDSPQPGDLDGEEHFGSFSITYGRQLNPKTSLSANAAYSTVFEPTTPGGGDATLSGGLSLSRRFPSDLFGVVSYLYRRQAPDTGPSTVENSATVRLRKQF